MSRAHRLIVVWMAGALGTVVVYGGRKLDLADRSASPVLAPSSEPSPPPPPSALADPRDAIVEYLKVRYDMPGLAYLGAPLVDVDSGRLRRLLPDTRFFRTTVQTGGLAYWSIDLLVSFRRVAGGDDIRSCMTATFDSGGHNLLSQFVGIPAPTVESRREVALAIAELLARPAYPGVVGVSEKSLFAARVELWHGDRHWRDIDVFSGWDGRVNRVAISNPIARVTEAIVSEF